MRTDPPLNPYVDVLYYRASRDNCYQYVNQYTTSCPYIRFQNSKSCYDLERRRYDQKIAYDTSGLPRQLISANAYDYDDSYTQIISTNCRNISATSYQPGYNVIVNNTILFLAFMLVLPAAYVSIKMISRIRSIWRSDR
jgi:hypothetical protein